jgi:hypothetical protein
VVTSWSHTSYRDVIVACRRERDDRPGRIEAAAELLGHDPDPAAAVDTARSAAARIRAMAASRPASQRPLPWASAVRIESVRGRQLDGLDELRRETEDAVSAFSSPPNGVERHKVATIRRDVPADRSLDGLDDEAIVAALRAQTENAWEPNRWTDEAVTASGGWCAPVEPIYDLLNISETQRPVRDSLPQFHASRGSVTFAPPPALGSVLVNPAGSHTAGRAVGVVTDAEDAVAQAKTVQVVPCPSPVVVKLNAIYRILKFGNLEDRAWPELPSTWGGLLLSAHARLAESVLLKAIGDGSTAVTGGPTTYGAAPAILSQMNRACATYRNRHRMAPNAMMRVMAPAWLVGMLQDDVAMRGFEGAELFGATEADVRAWMAVRHINLTLFWDGETSGGATGQVVGAQPASVAVLSWPDTVIWYAFAEGSWVYLDNGELDLGVVRDSTLNSTNDYETFAESFEAVAGMGVESLRVTSTLCANGAAGGTVTPVCAGS